MIHVESIWILIYISNDLLPCKYGLNLLIQMLFRVTNDIYLLIKVGFNAIWSSSTRIRASGNEARTNNNVRIKTRNLYLVFNWNWSWNWNWFCSHLISNKFILLTFFSPIDRLSCFRFDDYQWNKQSASNHTKIENFMWVRIHSSFDQPFFGFFYVVCISLNRDTISKDCELTLFNAS